MKVNKMKGFVKVLTSVNLSSSTKKKIDEIIIHRIEREFNRLHKDFIVETDMKFEN